MNHLYYGPWILFRAMIVASLLSFLSQSTVLAQSISITAPTSGGTLAPNANYTFQVATSGSVTSVVYWVDNWSWIGQSNSAPFSLTWLNNLSNGSHIIKARANFANGSTLDATDVSFTVGSGGGSGSTSTLTPTDDRDAQSDGTAGTNAVINTSQWNTSFFRFNMTGISGTASSAKLRLYKGASASSGMSVTIQYTTTDSWTQSGANPGVGSVILTSSVADAAGYAEFDVTGAVQSRMSGTKLISFAVNTNAGGWTTLNAKESASNKPQLVIITGSGGSSGGSTNMKIGVNFWNISWEGWADYFQSGVNWSTTTNPWNPALLTDLAPFSGPIRYMDFDNTNGSTIVNWSSRIQKTDNHYSTPSVAYEWMIDLCNRSSKDMWVCVPTYSNSDYWTQLATLIKNNLNSSRKLYLEYSNETWNGGFQQFQYCVSQGQSLGLPGSNQYYQGGAFSVYRSLQIFQAFQQVFGASAMGSRVIRVCSFSGNMDIADQAFANVLSSSAWNPNNQHVDMAAIAPYIGPNDDVGGGVLDGAESNIAARFRANVDWNYTHYIQPAITIANKYGFRLGCYEGGQQLTTNAGTWSANPDIYAEYTYMLDKWKPANFVLFNHYTLYGAYSGGGAWGAKADVAKTTANSPKYHALIDWMTTNPAPNTATADSLSARPTPEEAIAAEAGFRLRVYPNPASGSLHIDGTGIAKPDVLIRLLNGNGQTLLRRHATAPGGILSTNLDVSQMNSGIYFLQLNSGGKQYIRKVLVK